MILHIHSKRIFYSFPACCYVLLFNVPTSYENKNYFNQEEDFATEDEYNDYLEEIECIVYNLCNNIDIVNTNKKIEQYKKDNRDTIMKNKNRLGREEYELELELEREKQIEAERKKELLQIEQVNSIFCIFL